MINKVRPQKLNSSIDSRLRASTDMIDALNVSLGDRFSGDSTGDSGVLKAALSNERVDGMHNGNAAIRVIGSVTDDVLNVVFFFVWSDDPDNMGVWAFDRDAVLPGNENPGTYVKVYTSSYFNFPSDGFVKGDVVHVGQLGSDIPKPEEDVNAFAGEHNVILYFTDNVNEPKKIDVFRVMTSDFSDYEEEDILDLITACPRTPQEPITFEFSTDPNRFVSNFVSLPGMQFAYQYIYAGNIESAISTYSKLAIPPAYINLGSVTQDPNLENRCTLTVPQGTKEVLKTRILVRYGNNGVFKAIDETTEPTYDFYNDRVLVPVGSKEEGRQFDNLPRKAQAQAVVSDRLVYGNYTEGYPETPVRGSGAPIYRPTAENISLELEVTPVIIQSLHPVDGIGHNRVAGFKISTDGIPSGEVEEGSVVSITFTVKPHEDFHFYDQTNSYHSSREAESGSYNVTTNGTPNSSSQYSDGNAFFGRNHGVSYIDGFNTWKQSHDSFDQIGSNIDVVYGTSAANPFILQGQSLIFSVKFQTNYTVAQGAANVRDAIYYFLTDGDVGLPTQPFINEEGQSELQPFATLIESQDTDGYNIDVNIPTINSNEVDPSEAFSKLIVSVNRAANSLDNTQSKAPIGYFLVTEADVEFGLKGFPFMNSLYTEDSESVFVGLDIKPLENVEVVTCIPHIPVDIYGDVSWEANAVDFNTQVVNLQMDGWLFFSRDFLMNELDIPGGVENNMMYLSPEAIQSQVDVNLDIDLGGFGSLGDIGTGLFMGLDQLNYNRRRHISGYLLPPSGNINDGLELIHTSSEIHSELLGLIESNSDFAGSIYAPHEISVFSVLDSEGTAGEDTLKPVVDIGALLLLYPSLGGGFLEMAETYSVIDGSKWFSSIIPASIWMGHIGSRKLVAVGSPNAFQLTTAFIDSPGAFVNFFSTFVPNQQDSAGEAAANISNAMVYSGNPYSLNTRVEVLASDSFTSIEGSTYHHKTFKSKANHEFGIVYYDQRGRSGHVNFLDNVYVGGYSNTERPLTLKGRVDIELDLQSIPPPWSTHYQIVYGGNSTYQDFVQYSVGPAFIDYFGDEETAVDEDSTLIYVSLNHLQGVNGISYTNSFGAVNASGGKDMYAFQKGDKLRILSYVDSSISPHRIYPHKYEFEISDLVTFGKNITADGPEDSILDVWYENTFMHPSKVGQFLVLKNNPSALGFSYIDIFQAHENADNILVEYFGDTDQHNWNDEVIVEIYSPKRVQDFDDRVYYEIGEKFNVVQNEQGLNTHESNPILLEDGDMYWRRVPVNTPPFDSELGVHRVLLRLDSNNETIAIPRFRNKYLETTAFVDVIPRCDSQDWGKPKINIPGVKTQNKRASLIYSGKNNYSARFNRFTIFNASTINFKDIPNEYGAINYILNDYDSIFIIQENKCSAIPVSRNIIQTASGQQSLTTTSDILGTQKFYSGNFGADNNPESVTRAGHNIYFVSKSLREVYRWTRNNGLEVISNAGLKSYFDTLFREAIQSENDGEGKVRIVGGYDRLKDEFILSIFNMENLDPEDVEGEDETDDTDDDVIITDVSSLCFYPLLLDDDTGLITSNSITSAFNSVLQQLQEGLISQAQAIEMVPDYNNDGVISTADMLLILTEFSDQLNDGFSCDLLDTGGGGGGSGFDGQIFYGLNETDPPLVPLDFGAVERTDVGQNYSQQFVISNMSNEDIKVNLRPYPYEEKFYKNQRFGNPNNLGYYWNPSFDGVYNEEGVAQIGAAFGNDSTTTIPAGTHHTFTIKLNVSTQLHEGMTSNYWGTGVGNLADGSPAEDYLNEAWGSTKRAFTAAERQIAAEFFEVGSAAYNALNVPHYEHDIIFDVYDINDNLLDPQVEYPFAIKRFRYEVADSLEGGAEEVIEPLVWDGTSEGLCNYPVIIDADGNITLLSITLGFQNVQNQIENGLSHAEATHLFPDANSDGQIVVADRNQVISHVNQIEGVLSCSLGLIESDPPSILGALDSALQALNEPNPNN